MKIKKAIRLTIEFNQVITCFTFQQVLYFATLWIGIPLVHSTFSYQSVPPWTDSKPARLHEAGSFKNWSFWRKILTSYTVIFFITRTPVCQLWSSPVCDILMVVHTFNLRHERETVSKYFMSPDRLNHIISKPAVVLVFKWTSLTWEV